MNVSGTAILVVPTHGTATREQQYSSTAIETSPRAHCKRSNSAVRCADLAKPEVNVCPRRVECWLTGPLQLARSRGSRVGVAALVRFSRRHHRHTTVPRYPAVRGTSALSKPRSTLCARRSSESQRTRRLAYERANPYERKGKFSCPRSPRRAGALDTERKTAGQYRAVKRPEAVLPAARTHESPGALALP